MNTLLVSTCKVLGYKVDWQVRRSGPMSAFLIRPDGYFIGPLAMSSGKETDYTQAIMENEGLIRWHLSINEGINVL